MQPSAEDNQRNERAQEYEVMPRWELGPEVEVHWHEQREEQYGKQISGRASIARDSNAGGTREPSDEHAK